MARRLAICSTEPSRSGSPAEILRRCVIPSGWTLADPDNADLIVFAESHRDDATCGRFLTNVRTHPVYRRHRARCVVHCGSDRPVPLVPGFYPSIPTRWHDARWTRSTSYLVEENPLVLEAEGDASRTEASTLASFVGACRGKSVRQRLLAHRSASLVVQDTGEEFVGAIRAGDLHRLRELKLAYVQSIVRSRFVLCPRGTGASSIRLFETMRLGRVPVIIADDWVEPVGPDWAAFSVRIAERDLGELESRLDRVAHRAAAMGQLAREAWESHFSPATLLKGIVEQGLELIEQPAARRVPGRVRGAASAARPEIVRRESKRLRSVLRSAGGR